jgi:putative heme-binding domain-containing protein
VELQTSRSDWHARRARVLLQGRAAAKTLGPGTHEALRQVFRTSADADVRLRAMWALHVTAGWSAASLAETLSDRDEYIRAWAVQLLTEDRAAAPAVIETFVRMAREDGSPAVRLYLASALQRVEEAARWRIASGLMGHAEDANDPNLPTMVWLGIEPLVPGNPAVALEHASRARIPRVARFIARRSVDADALEPLMGAIGRSPRSIVSLLEGLRDGLEGRFDLAPPASWAPLAARLTRGEPAVARLAADISQRFGDTEAATRNLAALRSRSGPVEQRRRALQSLAARRQPSLVAELPAILDDPGLRVDAIRAIAAFDDEALGKLLITRYPGFDPVEKSEAIQTLASRARYGRLLTDALVAGTVPRRDVPPHLARQVRRSVGVKFADVWGPVESDTAQDRAFSKYRSLLNEQAVSVADIRQGRAVFQQTCAACHKLHGEGGTVGPDLTGSNRANLEYLLFNVLNPNGDVADAYRMQVVVTRDGRTYSGSVATETERQLTLQVAGQGTATINKADIQTRETTTQSMMPPGLFEGLTDREVIDLVGYLRTIDAVKTP